MGEGGARRAVRVARRAQSAHSRAAAGGGLRRRAAAEGGRHKMLYVLETVIKILAIIVPLLIAVAYVTLAERKILASMQLRVGPNVVGVAGLLQPLADGVKLFSKETILPTHANLVIFLVAPVVALSLSLIT